MKEESKTQKSILVSLWSCIFRGLSYISLFGFIRYVMRKCNIDITYRFVDIWVIFCFSLSILLSITTKYVSSDALLLIIIGYSLLRISEILIYQINVVLFDPFLDGKVKKDYKVKSIQRMIIALLMNYVEIIFLFTSLSYATIIFFETGVNMDWGSVFQNNIFTVMTLSPSEYNIVKGITHVIISYIVTFEVVAGLVMSVVSLSRFIGLLPQLGQIDE